MKISELERLQSLRKNAEIPIAIEGENYNITVGQIMDAVPPIEVHDTEEADLILADENENPIATFADGHIRTANFDSANIQAQASGAHPVEVRDITTADLILADENQTPIATFAGGHIRTANFDSANIAASGASASGKELTLPGKWCALGTSITAWDSTRVNGIKGYQYWVKKRISFAGGYVNKGVNGYQMASLAQNLSLVVQADYYTLEFGTNDMQGGVVPGTLADYTGATGINTFAGAMRIVIDRIYQINPSAMIILCTPRKFYNPGFGLMAWHAQNAAGARLVDFVNLIREIAQYESFPVADFFALSNTNSRNLVALSNEEALHPTTEGHKLMANVLCEQFRLLYHYDS